MAFLALIASFFAGSVSAIYAYKLFLRKIQEGEESSSGTSLTFSGSGGNRARGSMALDRSVNASTAVTTDGSGVFIADLLQHLWKHMNVAICKSVRESVEPMFKEMLPAPLNTLHFTKLSLGDVPLRIDSMRVHPPQMNHFTGKPFILMEMDVLWNGECKIALKADYLGSLGVKSIKFAGRLSVILSPLLEEIPITGAVQYGFVSTPSLRLDFTGLANVADLSTIKKTIYSTVDTVLQDMMVLPKMMSSKIAAPEQVSFLTMYHPPHAILRLSVVRGRGFQPEQRGPLRAADIPDVYVTCKVGDVVKDEWRTSTRKNSLTPEWRDSNSSTGYECCDFELFDYNQVIYVKAFDEDTGALDTDDELGVCQLTVGDLLLQPRQACELELFTTMTSGKCTGAYVTLQAQVLNFDNSDKACDLATMRKEAASSSKPPQSKRMHGLLTILVAQAHDVPNQPDASVVEASNATVVECDDKDDEEEMAKIKAAQDEVAQAPPVHVRVTVGTKTRIYTPALSGCMNPEFDTAFRVPLTSDVLEDVVNDGGKLLPVCFTLVQGDPPAADEKGGVEEDEEAELITLGSFEVSHDAILKSPHHKVLGKQRMKGGPSSLEYCVSLSGLQVPKAGADLATAKEGFGQAHSNDIGTKAGDATKTTMVRITVVKGWGFQVEKRGGLKKDDIPDIYCSLRFGASPTVWRTNTIKNSTTPEWGADANASKTYPMQHPDQVLQMDVWDEDAGQRDGDDSLGSVRIPIGKLLLTGGTTNVELELHGKPTGAFVTLQCQTVEEGFVPSLAEPTVFENELTSSTSQEEPPLKEEVHIVKRRSSSGKGSPFRVTVLKGWGFQVQKRRMKKDDIPDAYVKIQLLDSKQEPWTTTVKKDTCTPEWNESHVFYKVGKRSHMLQINVWDRDTGVSDADDNLGCALISLDKLLSAAGGEDGLALSLLDKDGNSNGCFVSLRCNATSGGETNGHSTAKEEASLKATEVVTPSEGRSSTSESNNNAKLERAGTETSVEVTTEYIQVEKSEVPAAESVVSITVAKGRGFKVQKGRGLVKKRDVPDVYVELKLGDATDLWRTPTIDNNVEPVWNESRKFVIASTSSYDDTMIAITVMDEDSGRNDDDDFLGKASISVGELLRASTKELELQTENGETNGCYITLCCTKL